MKCNRCNSSSLGGRVQECFWFWFWLFVENYWHLGSRQDQWPIALRNSSVKVMEGDGVWEGLGRMLESLRQAILNGGRIPRTRFYWKLITGFRLMPNILFAFRLFLPGRVRPNATNRWPTVYTRGPMACNGKIYLTDNKSNRLLLGRVGVCVVRAGGTLTSHKIGVGRVQPIDITQCRCYCSV